MSINLTKRQKTLYNERLRNSRCQDTDDSDSTKSDDSDDTRTKSDNSEENVGKSDNVPEEIFALEATLENPAKTNLPQDALDSDDCDEFALLPEELGNTSVDPDESAVSCSADPHQIVIQTDGVNEIQIRSCGSVEIVLTPMEGNEDRPANDADIEENSAESELYPSMILDPTDGTEMLAGAAADCGEVPAPLTPLKQMLQEQLEASFKENALSESEPDYAEHNRRIRDLLTHIQRFSIALMEEAAEALKEEQKEKAKKSKSAHE